MVSAIIVRHDNGRGAHLALSYPLHSIRRICSWFGEYICQTVKILIIVRATNCYKDGTTAPTK